MAYDKERVIRQQGELVAENGVFDLILDPDKAIDSQACLICRQLYATHGSLEHPLDPSELKILGPVWNERFVKRRFRHINMSCPEDGKTLRVGPDARLAGWSKPLLQSLRVLGLSVYQINDIFPESLLSVATVWRRVKDLDEEGYFLSSSNRGEGRNKHLRAEFSLTESDDEIPVLGWQVKVVGPIHLASEQYLQKIAKDSKSMPKVGTLSFELL